MYQASQNEQEILKYWDEHRCFEKSVQNRPESKPYVFYDGPPFATGLPHYGHILSSVIKDVVPRYWTMKGFRVRRRWGWDCHGLPIESLVEKELGFSGKKDIEEKLGVEKFNETCRSKVLIYIKEWKKMINRIGRWIEFDNAYKTMDSTYMESVWWAIKQIWDKGLIYEGRKVLMYCPRCETPVSKAEVAMDESYKDIIEEAVTIKFRIKNYELRIKNLGLTNDIYILAWTTTPWTLLGNVALAVGENIEYWILNIVGKDGFYVVAKDRVEAVTGDRRYEIKKKIKGADLVGLEYEPLYEIPAVKNSGKKAWYVTAADFVNIEEGTGIVHTAVVYGEEDYELGVKIGLPVVPLLDEKGKFNLDAPELVRGLYFKDSEKIVKDDLEKRGLMFARENHTHSYPHCWRCDTQLFYNAISAWFINIQKIKKRLIKLNEKISWYPEHLKRGRFLDILETAPDWNISRNRYWATPLPFWKCECGHAECLGSVEELKEKAVNFDEVYEIDKVERLDLHKHQMDKIHLRCPKCAKKMSRVPEVIDCWVESASMPFAEFHYPFENKAVFKSRFPGQYIAEYIAQTRAWFYYMHVMAVLLFDNISFENCVVTGTILNEKGEKLSKSKMNYTDPWVIIEQYGVDALRYYLMTSVVMQAENLFFNDREVRDVYNKLINTLWNVVEFYRLYSHELKANNLRINANHVLDRWILAKLQLLIQEVTENMDNYNMVRASRPMADFVADLSQWWLRRSRARFKSDDAEEKNQALSTLGEVLLTLSKMTAPFTPFIAEKIYQEITTSRHHDITTSRKESVHLEEWPVADKKMIDEKLLAEMEKVRKIVEMGLAIRAEKGIKVRQPLNRLQVTRLPARQAGYRLQEEYQKIIADELNVKEIVEIAEIKKLRNWEIKEDGGLKVALNVEVTEELKKEGLVREIIRAINQMRKEQGLTIKDRVEIIYDTEDKKLKSLFDEFSPQIAKQVLAKEIKSGKVEGGKELLIGDNKITIKLIN